MKKVYQSSKYKNYVQHKYYRWLRLKEKERAPKKRLRSIIRSHRKESSSIRSKRRKLGKKLLANQRKHVTVNLRAPIIFSLDKYIHADAACLIFDQLNTHLHQGKPVFFDLSMVRYLSGAPLTYLLSVMDIYKQQNALDIKGNEPSFKPSRWLLDKSGFFNYVKRTTPEEFFPNVQSMFLHIENGKNYKTTGGNNAIARIIEIIKAYLLSTSGNSRCNFKPLFTIFSEVLNNVYDHAYVSEGLTYTPTWWLSITKKIAGLSVALLDNGETIPKTVQKFFKDYLVQTNFIESALKETLPRSETQESHRGQGMPTILKTFYSCAMLKRMTILSGEEYVTVLDNRSIQTQRLSTAFKGTAYIFDLEGE